VKSFLADSSIWSWAWGGRRDDIRRRLGERAQRDQLVICLPVVLEVQHLARTGEEYDELYAKAFTSVEWLPSGEAAWRRAFEVQRGLAHAGDGRHRRPAMDYVIAATAELAGPDVVLWAFDRDMQVICEHTDQPCELETTEPDN
jgi:predicted nucleic acid-binding protein